uniref:Tetraspanin-10 n=1 Tax=Laticauda laticaudata TaxID=8630 RepID=A0A8C5S8A0_LATLA
MDKKVVVLGIRQDNGTSFISLPIFLWIHLATVLNESLESERITYLGSDPMLFFVLVGLVATSISLLGCIGALFESIFLLKLFTGGIMLSLVLEVLSGIVVFSLRQHIKSSLQNFLMVAMLQYQDDLDLQFIMDEIQAGLQCCGVKSYLDWKANLYFNCTSPGVQACGVPASCCVNPLENGTILNSQCGFGTLGMEEFAVQSTIYLGGCVPHWFLYGFILLILLVPCFLIIPATSSLCTCL